MDSDPNSDTELLTEHFGYPPVSLLDDIINAVNILSESALKSIEQGLLKSPPAVLGFRAPSKPAQETSGPSPRTIEEVAQYEIDNGTHQLETLLCSSIDRDFDLFELYVMRNILCVRPQDRDWMRLSHYEDLDFSAVAGNDEAMGQVVDGAPTVDSVNALRRKLQASQRLNAMLHVEQTQNDALLKQLRAAIRGDSEGEPSSIKNDPESKSQEPSSTSPFAFLQNKGPLVSSGDAATPIQTTTAFALSQLQALRALSTSLRTLIPDLRSETSPEDLLSSGDGSRRTWRRDRVGYIESSTRRHLEISRDLELDSQGAVRDGEWQGEGRKYSRAEVEDLEQAVTILGGGVGKDQGRDDGVPS